MRLALGIAFGMLVVAPLFGRWRARVWLRKNRAVKTANYRVISVLNCAGSVESGSTSVPIERSTL